MTASTILQLSLSQSAKRFYQVIFKVCPFSLAISKDFNTLSLNQDYQYSSINCIFLSTIEQRLALYILSRQSVITVGCILQQLITLQGRQLQDQLQVFLLIPQSKKGIFTFQTSYLRNTSCRLFKSQILILSYSPVCSLFITRSTLLMPPLGSFGLLISGMKFQISLAFLYTFSRFDCLEKAYKLLNTILLYVILRPILLNVETSILYDIFLFQIIIMVMQGYHLIMINTIYRWLNDTHSGNKRYCEEHICVIYIYDQLMLSKMKQIEQSFAIFIFLQHRPIQHHITPHPTTTNTMNAYQKYHQTPLPIITHLKHQNFVLLEVNTWAKDSHGLYDYQDNQLKTNKEKFYIQRNCRVYRHATQMKTVVQYDQNQKQMPIQYIYIGSVILNPQTKAFTLQSADCSGIQPHPFIRQENPDLFRNNYLAIRDFSKQNNEGYPLELGTYVKLGRIEYLVIEKRDGEGLKRLKQTSHLQINNGTYKVTQELKGSCKICLCEENLINDPLISPCSCRGSCELVHTGCLKNWINSKVKKQTNNIATSYNFSKFECQICKALFPKWILLKNGQQIDMITFEKPDRCYLILESVTQRFQRRDQVRQRNLHIIHPNQKVPIKLGRGHQCEIRITDISVSRVHAEIRFENNKFFVKDSQSKFGTLIKFRQQVGISSSVKIQSGRTYFNFQLKQKSQKREDKCIPTKKRCISESEQFSQGPQYSSEESLSENYY